MAGKTPTYCVSPINLKNPKKIADSKVMRVPCGRCGACLAKRRADWSFRISEELRVSKTAWFITLTYDDQKLEWSNEGIPTIEKRTLQLFLKRLRKTQHKISPWKIRYYAVGEYGTTTDRPHYHIIIFNISKHVLNILPEIWGLGNIHVGQVTEASIHYITKYHVNRHANPVMDEMRTPEFALMSKRPAIGHSYIQRATKWHKDNQYGYVINNGFKQNMPQYYKDKIFNKGEQNGIAQRHMSEAEKQLVKDITKLTKLNNPSPELDLEIRALINAQQYKNKVKKQDKL